MINQDLIKNGRSYASVENLEKALIKYNLVQFSPIVVGIPNTTRVTAIFQFHRLNNNPLPILHLGFAVV